MPLDTSKLINLKSLGGNKWVSACPMCQSQGSDLKGRNHLTIFPSGKFSCVVDKSKEHNRGIWQLAGIGGSGEYDPTTMYQEPDEPVVEAPPTIWPVSVLDTLVKDYSYWEGRGVSREAIEEFGGGVATDKAMKGRFVFPILNDDGKIVAFTARDVTGKSNLKWLHYPKGCRTGQWVFGGLDEIESSRRAILVESIGDLLALKTHGIHDVLCIFGTNVSQAVLGKLISMNPSRIIISTNLDTAKMMNGIVSYPGQAAAKRAKNSLDIFFDPDSVEILHPEEGTKDWGCATREQILRAFSLQEEPVQNPAEESPETDANCLDIDPNPDTLSFT